MDNAPLVNDSESSAQSGSSVCTFYQRGDNVHIPSTPPKQASGHGWWDNTDCDTDKADVTIQLQVYRPATKTWVNIGSPGKKRVYAGGGSANRAATQVTCTSGANTHWRSYVDVDLVGIVDSANKTLTPDLALACFA